MQQYPKTRSMPWSGPGPVRQLGRIPENCRRQYFPCSQSQPERWMTPATEPWEGFGWHRKASGARVQAKPCSRGLYPDWSISGSSPSHRGSVRALLRRQRSRWGVPRFRSRKWTSTRGTHHLDAEATSPLAAVAAASRGRGFSRAYWPERPARCFGNRLLGKRRCASTLCRESQGE